MTSSAACSIPILGITRLPDAGSAQLWLVDLDAPLDADAHVSLAEKERARRYAFDRDRHRYLRAHSALRALLASAVERPANSLVFDIGTAGKPALRGHPSWHFNLSHSSHRGLVAIGRSDAVGIDIELLRPIDDRADLARQHFDPVERAAIDVDGDGTAFLCGWTRKEACLKAVGTGLDRDLRQLHTGCTTDTRRVDISVEGRQRSVIVGSWVHGDDFVASWARVLPEARSAAR